MFTKEQLSKIDFSSLWEFERERVWELIKELTIRKNRYPIISYKPQPYQQEFIDAVMARNPDWTPRYKFIIFIWGNWVGKTQTWGYITCCASMWEKAKELGLPYIGKFPIIKIVTSTWSQVTENIEPYILWTSTDQDLVKLPDYFDKDDAGIYVKAVRKDKDILKSIEMQTSTMYFGTYDQGQERLQGWSPDLTWIDEIPKRWADFRELIRGTRKMNWQFLMTFTPTNYNKKIRDWIFWGQANKFVRTVNSRENKYADRSWMEGFTEEEKRIVEAWEFIPSSGLVYKNFDRNFNVVKDVNVRQLEWSVKFYWALDFWVNHPMAFLFIVVDADWRVIVFDEIYKSDMLLSELVKEVNSKKMQYWIEFEYIVADSAWKRERMELANLWMNTRKAKKRKKEWVMSNRKWGIFKINNLLNIWKLFIAEKCVSIIEEFETHHFADTGEDWTVKKENDDALDALRYFIFSYGEKTATKILERKRSRIIRSNRSTKRY